MKPHPDWIRPDWQAPASVRALITTRQGGHSVGAFASMNLGTRVQDDPVHVARNHQLLQAALPQAPRWIKQVHGACVVDAAHWQPEVEADAIHTDATGVVCAVTVADCLPVLFCEQDGACVAAAHAGWRGLSAGVLENTVRSLQVDPGRLLAYLGPGIGARAFEVGEDVQHAFTARDAAAGAAFQALGRGKWLCDLFALARMRLARAGVRKVYGGQDCTYSDPARFYSHRRDRSTGRMAALIWLEQPCRP